jgi:hypothetical protein
MSIAGSKRNKAESVMSTKSTGGKALDKHCFGTTIKGKQCNGSKISGANFSRHKNVEHGGKDDFKVEVCKDGCQYC